MNRYMYRYETVNLDNGEVSGVYSTEEEAYYYCQRNEWVSTVLISEEAIQTLLKKQATNAQKEGTQMSKGTVFVVLGLSGAGKDIVYEVLRRERELPDREVHNIKFSGLMKRTFEQWYDVPKGSFDDREFREQLVPGTDMTYLDVMVKAYHAWENIDPLLTVRPTIQQAQTLLENGHDVVITDCRKMGEAKAIVDIHQCGYNLRLIHVYGRVGETRKSSDVLLENLISYIHNSAYSDFYTFSKVANTGDLAYLAQQMYAFNLFNAI